MSAPSLAECTVEALGPWMAYAATNRGSAATQGQALAAVCAFLPMDAPSTDEERACCAAAYTCLHWVLTVLGDHGAGDVSLCERALFLLRRVASNAVQGAAANAPQGRMVVGAALAALEAHQASPEIVAQALGCLTNLGLTELLSEDLIGLVPTVLAAVERHAAFVIVARPGARFLLNCSSRRVHREVLVPAVPRLLAVVRHHVGNVATLLGALGFLNNLALAGGSFVQGPDPPARAGVPLALHAVGAHHCMVPHLVDTAVSALWNAQLALGPRPLLTLSLVPALLEVLKLRGTDLRVVSIALKLLVPLVPELEDVDPVLAAVVCLKVGQRTRTFSEVVEALLTQQGVLEARWSVLRRAWCGAVVVSTLRRHGVRR